jgi:hypothetical protein
LPCFHGKYLNNWKFNRERLWVFQKPSHSLYCDFCHLAMNLIFKSNQRKSIVSLTPVVYVLHPSPLHSHSFIACSITYSFILYTLM